MPKLKKKGGANKKKKDLFAMFHENENNENTAFILILGVLSEKLTDIADLISMSNKLSKEILSSLDGAKNSPRKEIVIVQPLSKEDYME